MNCKKLLIVIGGMLTTSRVAHLSKILEIVKKLFSEIVIIHEGSIPFTIESKKVKIICTGIQNTEAKISFLQRIAECIIQDFEKCKIVLKYAEKGDLALFLGIYQPISFLFTKFRKCSTIVFGGGFDITHSDAQNKFFDALYFIFRWSFQIGMLRHFDKIILESPSVKDFYNLGCFYKKIFYAHLFIPNIFTLTNPINQRDVDVAFIGVLSKEKGILEFLESCNILKSYNIHVKIIIWGDGILKDMVKYYINKNDLSNFVQLKNFVTHQDVPKILNRIKLIVIPSYSEGLPNRLIEAMACGTPPLAMPVGGIPDVIKEGVTGFLLKSNDPKHIANKIIELLSKPELLEKVSKNAYEYVREKFNYKKTLESWQKILRELTKES
ncbi:MAG: glycosyltransferase [Candidatus Aenigmatarchaeota archaeon]